MIDVPRDMQKSITTGLMFRKLFMPTPPRFCKNGLLADGRVAEVFEGLTFVTVIGAGHEVPLSKPHAAFELFKYFLRGKPLPK
ncbi:unnamed protein product [Brassica rapa subsp. narinosa]|nr:unnamed protein product [Brassica napus]